MVRGYRRSGDRKIYRYYVCIHSEANYKKLEKVSPNAPALAYANANANANALSRDEGAYPAEPCPVTYMTMRPGFGYGRVTTEVAMGKEVTR